MAFPIVPNINDTYVSGGVQYKWNGYAWDVEHMIGSASISVKEYIATAGQTTFFAGYYTSSDSLDVYVNGNKLAGSEFTATDNTNIILDVAANLNDIVEIRIFAMVNFADVVSSSQLTTALTTKSDVAHTHTFASVTSKPTTVAGYGITDAYTIAQVDAALTSKSDTSHTHTALTGLTVTGLKEMKVVMGATNNIDMNAGNLFTKTISGATTLSIVNMPASGVVGYVILELTNAGSAVVTWFNGIKWPGGTAPTLTAAGKDILSFYTHDGAVTWNVIGISKDVK